jgi:hypothetical protein
MYLEATASLPAGHQRVTPGAYFAWVLMSQSLHGEKDGHVVIFKRPLPADQPADTPETAI